MAKRKIGAAGDLVKGNTETAGKTRKVQTYQKVSFITSPAAFDK